MPVSWGGGTAGWAGGAGAGVTNSAGNNVVPKSDGTNLVASAITDDGATITAQIVEATDPTQYGQMVVNSSGASLYTENSAASATVGISLPSLTSSLVELNADSVTIDATDAVSISNGTVKTRETILTDGTGAALDVTATLPASPSAAVSGVNVAVTSAGSAVQDQSALTSTIKDGYSGGNSAIAVYGSNEVKSGEYNIGVKGLAYPDTGATKVHVGVWGTGGRGDSAYGVIGNTQGIATADVGGYFYAVQAFSTYSAALVAKLGNFGGINTSAALIADNGTVAAPIFLARDNGTTVFSVEDGGQVRHADGNAGAPSISFTNATSAGFYQNGNALGVSVGGGTRCYFGTTEYRLSPSLAFGWSAADADPLGVLDTMLARAAAATLQLGGFSAATPVAQTLQAQGSRGGTDTDVRGAKLTIQSGIGTGTGGGGDLALRTARSGATGTAANVPVDRIVLASKAVTLTESSATAVLDVTITNNTAGGGTLWYTIYAYDGSDVQALRGRVIWAAANNGGNFTLALGTPEEVSACTAGTLTNTVTIEDDTNAIVTLLLNAVSSLTQTTLVAYVSAQLDGTENVTTK